MKIVICGSIKFTYEINDLKKTLESNGHEVTIPGTSEKILSGEIDYDEFMAKKEKEGDNSVRKAAKEDLIKRYYRLIAKSDALLIANYDKNGIECYIGGNTLIEMAFAHILDKKIFLLKPIPEMGYSDEIKAMEPININGNLSEIK